MTVRVQKDGFEPWRELATYQETRTVDWAGQYGATAVFIGSLRDFNQGHAVSGMTLEHYPGMTEGYLEKISAEARARWELLDTLMVHRYGLLLPGEPIVLVAVWSAHRDAAFAACRYLIDELKTRAPFWKQETTPSGLRWVEEKKL
ncbi:MAG TPA: molybdenum cofactor biosynthesis protein MoaE [Acidiferrobacterales bacterium]|nr:molybdenum cofactor biosynthesis protein MoaE [Acidiferrobacterales bacterium]